MRTLPASSDALAVIDAKLASGTVKPVNDQSPLASVVAVYVTTPPPTKFWVMVTVLPAGKSEVPLKVTN